MSRLLSLLTALAISMGPAAASLPPQSPAGWERADIPRRSLDSDALQVATAGQWVYVISPGQVKVELLTVLGQTLTSVTLPPGCHRFHIASRGIYILRAASSTYRITL